MGLSKFKYSNKEWLIIKLLTLFLWIYPIFKVVYRYNNIPFPEGICRLADLTFVTKEPYSTIIFLGAAVFSVLYILEKYMVVATFFLALISIVVFSIERSNGIFHRKELLSMIFLIQFIAYLRYYLSGQKFKSETKPFSIAIMYSVQIVAAAYMIAGITKLMHSGPDWIADSPNAALQVLKSFGQKSIDMESDKLYAYGNFVSTVMVNFPNIVRFFMAIALFLELCAFLAMLSKKWAARYGLMLILLHSVMFFLMGIYLIAFIGPVLIYLVNIPGMIKSRKLEQPLYETVSA